MAVEKHADGTSKRDKGGAAKQSTFIVAEWPITKLVEYPNNPRNNDHAVERMCETIREFGFRVPIVATSNGEVVDGHLRLKAARALGLKKVPVTLADDLTPVQIRAFRIVANTSAAWASWNPDLLESELAQLRAVDFDLEPLGLEDIQLPEIEEQVNSPAPPRANRTKTTIFVSIANEQVTKARKIIVTALDKAKIPHNL